MCRANILRPTTLQRLPIRSTRAADMASAAPQRRARRAAVRVSPGGLGMTAALRLECRLRKCCWCATDVANAQTTDPCTPPSPCQNGAVCKDDKCICKPGWTGLACENEATCSGQNYCSGHGECNAGSCTCDAGWTSQADCSCPDDSTARCSVPARNEITYDVWTGIKSASISALTSYRAYPDAPTKTSLVKRVRGVPAWFDCCLWLLYQRFEITPNNYKYYGGRMHGYLYPTVTGQYQFFVSGDDSVELWLR